MAVVAAVLLLLLLAATAKVGSVSPVIGIDLGTTLSVVAYVTAGQVDVLENEGGMRGTPSVVSISEQGDVLVGDAAFNNMVRNPERTFSSVKRILGRKYSHPDVATQKMEVAYPIVNCDDYLGDKNAMQFSSRDADKIFDGTVAATFHWLYGHDESGSGRPRSDVTWRRGDGSACVLFEIAKQKIAFPAELISALVLTHLRKNAERKLGVKVTKAVISVPAYFSENQRSATLDAARIAGLDVLRLIPEPTAAALAFGLKIPDFFGVAERAILVFDLGGGTFDVSVLTFKKGTFNVLAIGGDNHCGGDDIDHTLAKAFEAEFSKAHPNLKIAATNQRARTRLLRVAEQAKKVLSFQTTTDVYVENLVNEHSFEYRLTRARFEQLNQRFFERLLPVVRSTLDSAQLRPEDIDAVLMVGGSSRIPKVNELVVDFFKRPLTYSVNPDEAIGIGAAMLAYKLSAAAGDPEKAQLPAGDAGGNFAQVLMGMASDWWQGPSPKEAVSGAQDPPTAESSIDDLSQQDPATRDPQATAKNSGGHHGNEDDASGASVIDRVSSVQLLDIAPHSLGQEVLGNKNVIMIKRFCPLPCTDTNTFTTTQDRQKFVKFTILEGESAVASENQVLGSFVLDGIEIARKGVPSFKVTYTLDLNGVLTVDAVDTMTKTSARKVLANTAWSRLRAEELPALREFADSLLTPRNIKTEV